MNTVSKYSKVKSMLILNKSYYGASYLQNKGQYVFPCFAEGEKKKRPRIAGWNEKDRKKVNMPWWKVNHPDSYWAFTCDQGLWGVDFDVQKEEFKNSKESQILLESFKHKYIIYDVTPSGGYHFIFRGEGKNTTSQVAPAVDTKGAGGCLIIYNHIFKKTSVDGLPQADFKDIFPNYNPTKSVTEGRNSKLFKDLVKAMREGRKDELTTYIEVAKNLGLPQNEIDDTVKSAEKAHAKEMAEKNSASAYFEKKYDEPINILEPIQKVVEFYPGIFVCNESFTVSGKNKLGKTRGMLALMAMALKQDKYKDVKGAILSTENDERMLVPLLKAYDILERIDICNPDIINEQDKVLLDKSSIRNAEIDRVDVKEYLKRIEGLIVKKGYGFLLIDPHPRTLNWNAAKVAEQYIGGINEITKRTGCIIGGVINDSKNQEHAQEHRASGSHVISARCRMNLRVIGSHPLSALAKKYVDEKNAEDKKGAEAMGITIEPNIFKAFYITSQYANSLTKPVAYICTLRKVSVECKVKEEDGSVKVQDVNTIIANLEKKIDDPKELERLMFDTTEESGFRPRYLIERYLIRHKEATRQELYNAHPFHNHENLRKQIDRMVEKEELVEEYETDKDGNPTDLAVYSLKRRNHIKEKFKRKSKLF